MFRLPILYAITDRELSGLGHPEQVRLLAAGGARLIQLRDKHSSPKEFHVEAAAAVKVAREFDVQIIINDRVDIAQAVAADGVHLGQDDMPPEAARRLLGDRAVIGFSTHDIEQAIVAASLPVDYLAIGPVFPTTSKNDTAPVVGLGGLATVRKAVREKPLVAIGGINFANAQSVLNAGADSVAVISALYVDLNETMQRVRDFLILQRGD